MRGATDGLVKQLPEIGFAGRAEPDQLFHVDRPAEIPGDIFQRRQYPLQVFLQVGNLRFRLSVNVHAMKPIGGGIAGGKNPALYKKFVLK